MVEERLSRLEQYALLELADIPGWAKDALHTAADAATAAAAAAEGAVGAGALPSENAAAAGDADGGGGGASVRKSTRKRKFQHASLAGVPSLSSIPALQLPRVHSASVLRLGIVVCLCIV